jgi:hypothetical protein
MTLPYEQAREPTEPGLAVALTSTLSRREREPKLTRAE